MALKIGKVLAVCISPYGGFPKYQQLEVELSETGFFGDKEKPRDRAISVVAKEVLDDVSQKFGLKLFPGDFAENITTEGLGDLSELKPGYLIKIGSRAILQVSAQNEPCWKLNKYCGNDLVAKYVFGKRGVVCDITAGVGQKICPGDAIEIIEESTVL